MAASVLQENSNNGAGSGTSVAVVFPFNVAAASSIHVIVNWDHSNGATLSCADNKNGSYGTAKDLILGTGGNQDMAHWVMDAALAGATTVTISLTGAGESFIGVDIREIGGTSGYDNHAAQKQSPPGLTTNAVSSGTATPSVQPGLISAASCNVTGGAGPVANAAFVDGGALWASGAPGRSESLRYTSTAALAATFTASSNDEHTTIAAFFKEATSGASGSAAVTEGADTAAGVGSVGVSGSAAITEGQDTAAGVGGDAVSGTATITEGLDTASGTGVAGAAGIAAITEGADVAAGTGTVVVAGSAAILGGPDAVSASGTNESDGVAAVTEDPDVALGSGTATSAGTGVAAIFEDGDIVVAMGSASGPLLSSNPSGGFLYEYERYSAARARRKYLEEEREAQLLLLQDERDREIALLLQAQVLRDEEEGDSRRLHTLALKYARERDAQELSDRVKVAYVRALAQANFSAMQALDRELQRMQDEEEHAVLLILLED